jgi:hypothetical protein
MDALALFVIGQMDGRSAMPPMWTMRCAASLVQCSGATRIICWCCAWVLPLPCCLNCKEVGYTHLLSHETGPGWSYPARYASRRVVPSLNVESPRPVWCAACATARVGPHVANRMNAPLHLLQAGLRLRPHWTYLVPTLTSLGLSSHGKKWAAGEEGRGTAQKLSASAGRAMTTFALSSPQAPRLQPIESHHSAGTSPLENRASRPLEWRLPT